MNSKTIPLSNGDKVTMYNEITRAIEKKIRVRSFQNTKLVRSATGDYVLEHLDIPEADKITDAKVLMLVLKVEKNDGTVLEPCTPEYLDNLLTKDFEMLSKQAVEVIAASSTSKTEEVKKD